MMNIFVDRAPHGVGRAHQELLTKEALGFVADLTLIFKDQIEQIYLLRKETNVKLSRKGPEFLYYLTNSAVDKEWTVDPPPPKLANRCLDLGDVSPADTHHLVEALKSDVDGIQVDFDDGHCPTWKNEILGHYNLMRAVRNELPGIAEIKLAPTLMVRPRAWNMTEYHMIVEGYPVPGPIFDFGLHMFHNGHLLFKAGVGPYFYLSKLESVLEAKLWNDIFIAAQEKLDIPQGTIKACILIENIIAAVQMEDILYQLRRHSIGLNCGVWDYCASIISKLGRDLEFILPDRNKYVNLEKHFLRKYMEKTVHVCLKRGTVATSGMATTLVDSRETAHKVYQTKMKELQMGFHGFLLYDVNLVPYVRMWQKSETLSPSVLSASSSIQVTIEDLLRVPKGGVTMDGLRHNTRVCLWFISNWLEGQGHFRLNNVIEDSATAEISRWQLWQWLRHETPIEDCSDKVDFELVQSNCIEICQASPELKLSAGILLELVTLVDPPEFITTFLSNSHLMREYTRVTASRL